MLRCHVNLARTRVEAYHTSVAAVAEPPPNIIWSHCMSSATHIKLWHRFNQVSLSTVLTFYQAHRHTSGIGTSSRYLDRDRPTCHNYGCCIYQQKWTKHNPNPPTHDNTPNNQPQPPNITPQPPPNPTKTVCCCFGLGWWCVGGVVLLCGCVWGGLVVVGSASKTKDGTCHYHQLCPSWLLSLHLAMKVPISHSDSRQHGFVGGYFSWTDACTLLQDRITPAVCCSTLLITAKHKSACI